MVDAVGGCVHSVNSALTRAFTRLLFSRPGGGDLRRGSECRMIAELAA